MPTRARRRRRTSTSGRAHGAAARAAGSVSTTSSTTEREQRSHANPSPSAGAGGPEKDPAAQRDEEKREPGEGEKTPVELVGRRRARRAARARGRAAVRGFGGNGLRLHDRLRCHAGLGFATGFGFAAGRLHRLGAHDRRGAVGRPARARASTGALRTGAGCVRVTGGGSGVTAFGGGSGDGVAARAGTARTTHSTARAPTGAPLRRSNDRLPCRAISPRSPGLFSKLLRFLECVNEALRPAGRPEAGLRGAAFCHSARDLPVAFAAASCSAADRPSANWPFFAD